MNLSGPHRGPMGVGTRGLRVGELTGFSPDLWGQPGFPRGKPKPLVTEKTGTRTAEPGTT